MEFEIAYTIENEVILPSDPVGLYRAVHCQEYTHPVKKFVIKERNLVKYMLQLFVLNDILPDHSEEYLDHEYIVKMRIKYDEHTKKVLDFVHKIIISFIRHRDPAEIIQLKDLSYERKLFYDSYATFIEKFYPIEQ